MSTTITSVKELQERLGGERTAMVTTVDERGTLSSRPVTIQRLDDVGDLWFLVDRSAEWVVPAEGSPINASVVEEGDTWVSFAGRATLTSDPATLEKLGDSLSETLFDEGSSPVVLRVVSDRIEWWTSPNKVAQVIEIAKGKVTGAKPDLGSSGTIEV